MLFARFVDKGVYEYTYFARATTPGEFKVPPATGYEQYFPEVWGRSDGGLFQVTDPSVAGPAVPASPRVTAAGLDGGRAARRDARRVAAVPPPLAGARMMLPNAWTALSPGGERAHNQRR